MEKITKKPRAAKRKTGIRYKITLFICLAALAIAFIGISSGYFLGYNLLSSTIGKYNKLIAQNLAVSVSELLEQNIRNIFVYVTEPVHREAILASEAKYKDKDRAEIETYFLQMDKQWVEAKPNSPLVTEYMRGKSAERLEKYTLLHKTIAEIFTTDKFGGLSAASSKTSDFYQADEEWWQKAYNSGKGAVYIGDIEYDESSEKTALPVAVPIRDEKGEVVGVCKAVLDVGVLFESLKNFKMGKTGHTVLADNNGFIIFHRGITPLSERFCGEKEFKSLVNNPKKWTILKNPHGHKKDEFISFAAVEHPLLAEKGINWWTFLDEEAQEVFLPVKILFVQMIGVVGTLIIILLPVAFIFSGILVKPIMKLYEVAECVGRGDLDYRIDLKTGDEIESLAIAFNKMTENLKRTVVSRDSLSEEVAERRKVEQNLSQALKKAVRSREIMTSMLDDNNRVREELESKLQELKKTQSMLVQSEKLASLGKLVADMAHEVNNPLMIISGNAQLSLLDESINGEVKNNLNIIHEECNRAKSIIQRLLMFSRPSKGEQKALDVNKSIESVAKLLEHQFSLGNVKIDIQFAEGLPFVVADEKQFQEVIMNLVNNARDAMPQGGNIVINTSLEGEYVKIEIKDSGSGMDDKTLAKIFEPFFTTKEKGTGLGLAVCYGIIKACKGRIEFKSQPQKGTTAHIWLPIKAEEK
ncbi:MAG: HAMP domain-containing protein [Candidatus Omnitrophica bacterium]|nr:HAMP domain-containing protein [Candidatus Omnitrophota bacterium]